MGPVLRTEEARFYYPRCTPRSGIVFGALGGILGALTLRALHRAGFFSYLAEKRGWRLIVIAFKYVRFPALGLHHQAKLV